MSSLDVRDKCEWQEDNGITCCNVKKMVSIIPEGACVYTIEQLHLRHQIGL